MNIESLKQFYAHLSNDKLGQLDRIYASDIRFFDPLHQIEGLPALHSYFKQLMLNLEYCRFEFSDEVQQGAQVMLTWKMLFVHPRLAKGKQITVLGCSHLQFNPQGLICQHRDYFDVSAMLHDHLPLVGTLSKKLKRGLGRV